jgi:hypothetical protein
MSDGKDLEPDQLQSNLQKISNIALQLAEKHQGDSLSLLAILRTLESLHHEIRDGLFQESLPDNRQALYSLLRDIESSGGWPYIHRMKLQLLLANLRTSLDDELEVLLLQPSKTESPETTD